MTLPYTLSSSCSDVSPPSATTVFSAQSADAFAKYIMGGGGYVGIHCASATAFLNPFYGRLVGAFFRYHPEIQPVGIRAINTNNPSTSRFPQVLNIDEEVSWSQSDEIDFELTSSVLYRCTTTSLILAMLLVVKMCY